MADKTPGQTAFEAYVAVDDASFPKLKDFTWEDVRPEKRVRWEMAELAVRRQLLLEQIEKLKATAEPTDTG